MVLFLLFVQLNVESPFLVKIQTEIEDKTIQTEMMMMTVVVMDQPDGKKQEQRPWMARRCFLYVNATAFRSWLLNRA